MKASLIEARKQAKVKKVSIKKPCQLSREQSNCDLKLNSNSSCSSKEEKKKNYGKKNSNLDLISCDNIKPRIQAQRKFASISALNISSYSSLKCQLENMSSVKEVFTQYQPSTEDFLTFLCLKDTSFLPLHLDLFALNGLSKKNVLLSSLRQSQEDYLFLHQSHTKSILKTFDDVHRLLNAGNFKNKSKKSRKEKKFLTSFQCKKNQKKFTNLTINGKNINKRMGKGDIKTVNRIKNNKATEVNLNKSNSRLQKRKSFFSKFKDEKSMMNLLKHEAKNKLVKSMKKKDIKENTISNKNFFKKINQERVLKSKNKKSKHLLSNMNNESSNSKANRKLQTKQSINLIKCAMILRSKKKKSSLNDVIKNKKNQVKVKGNIKKNLSSKNLIKTNRNKLLKKSDSVQKSNTNLYSKKKTEVNSTLNLKQKSKPDTKLTSKTKNQNLKKKISTKNDQSFPITTPVNHKPVPKMLEKMITRSATNNLKIRKMLNL